MRNVCRECRLYFVHQFLIEHIALGDGKYPLLVQHFRIESAQFIQQDFIFLPDIVAIGRHHEEQQRVTLDVPQKAQSQPFSGTGSFNDTGNVRHDKRLAVTVRNNTQIGFQCGEWIVGYLGLGGRYGSKQSRFSGIREAYQTYVCQEFQLHDYCHFLHRFTWLCKAGCLTGGCLEVPVTQSAASAFQQNNFLSMLGDVTDIFACFGIVYHCATGNFNNLIFSIFTKAAILGAGFSMSGQRMAIVTQVQQRPVVTVAAQNDMTSSSSVTSVGATIGYVFLTPHVRRASSALPGAAIYLYVVNKVRFSHFFPYD